MASLTGTIKRKTDKGFGFIAAPDGTEYFFHQSGCVGTSFDALRERQRVSFTVGQGRKAESGERETRVTAIRACQGVPGGGTHGELYIVRRDVAADRCELSGFVLSTVGPVRRGQILTILVNTPGL